MIRSAEMLIGDSKLNLKDGFPHRKTRALDHWHAIAQNVYYDHTQRV